MCQTRSKALLMSQNIILISFPSSNAFPKSFEILISWITVESPGLNPDWNFFMRIFFNKKLWTYLKIHLELFLGHYSVSGLSPILMKVVSQHWSIYPVYNVAISSWIISLLFWIISGAIYYQSSSYTECTNLFKYQSWG